MMIIKQIRYLTKDCHISEILRGSFWSFTLKVLAMIFGYVSTFFISNYFGARVVGLYNLSLSITNIITLVASLGFPMAILRFVGEYKEDRALIYILKRMLILSFVISLILILTFFLFGNFVSVKLFHDPELKKFLYVIFLTTPFAIIFTILVEFIRGLRLIKISESLRNSVSIFNLFFILLLIFIFKVGDLTPAIAKSLVNVLVFLVALFYVFKKIIPNIPLNSNTSVSYKKILKVSLPMFMTGSMFLVMGIADKLMLGFFRNSREVGIYSVAFKLATLNSMILIAINTIVGPKFSELYWSGRLDELKNVAHFSAKLIFYTSLPILIVYFLFSRQILSIFGKEFVKGSMTLIILSIGQFINAASGSVGYFLNMTGYQNIFRNIIFIAGLVNILLNFLLIPKFKYNGAAIATSISMIFWNVLALFYIKRKFGIYIGYLPFE